MKKVILALFLLVAVSGFTPTLFAQDLDEVLKLHFEAIGQSNVAKLKSITFTGKVIVQGGMIEIPMSMTQKRDNKMKTESTFQGQKFIEAYNGKTGWRINPFAGQTEPQAMTEDEIRSTKMQADLDGTLYNYAEKGYKAELVGTEDMEGSKVHKIRLTNKDGEQFTYFIDADSYVMLKTVSKVKMQGNEMESETFFGNYKQVEGMAFPYSMETKMMGQVVSQIVVDEVKLNPEIDDSTFEMPGGKTTATDAVKEEAKPAKNEKKAKKEKEAKK